MNKAVFELDGPKTYNEFLEKLELSDWPLSLTNERILVHDNPQPLGTQTDIANELIAAVSLKLQALDSLKGRINNLNIQTGDYVNIFFDDAPRNSRIANNMFYAPSEAFITEVTNSDAVVHHQGHKNRIKTLLEAMNEAKSLSLDETRFPGFRETELTELPRQLEAPHMLDRATRAQHFNAGFRKQWRKVFLSEASVAVLQDLFWWIFLDQFQRIDEANDPYGLEAEDNKLKLFDRISDSYASLFYFINPDFRDKFFKSYPDCLAQAMLLTFCESFPEAAQRVFRTDTFRQHITFLIHEWTTGTKPVPGTYMEWDLRKLLPTKSSRRSDQPLPEDFQDYALDIGEMRQSIEQLGQAATTVKFENTAGAEINRESSGVAAPSALSSRPHTSRSKMMTVQCRVREEFQAGQRIHRTQIVRHPDTSLATYKEVIRRRKSATVRLRTDHQRSVEDVAADLERSRSAQRLDDKAYRAERRRMIQGDVGSDEMKLLSQDIIFDEKEDYNVRKAMREHQETNKSAAAAQGQLMSSVLGASFTNDDDE